METEIIFTVEECPVCGSRNVRDKGSFDKCLDCAARFKLVVWGVPELVISDPGVTQELGSSPKE